MASKDRPAGMDSLKMNFGKSKFEGLGKVRSVAAGSPNAPKVAVPKRTTGGKTANR